ncbi:MAG: radical SAM protein [Nanoarchaeota archaeon]|nr:B12-binding domain-containing radical SAM protein [Nanoarchaeota archaeon]MBU2420104.1 B12-binding domain-containing radical SAM protein [Nanoarchaeota archaeon]MBU2475741.1 B12-binding domain-containing radical SAM protein [Nanoarchaeota archaeon]
MKVVLISTSTYPADQGIRSVSSFLKKAGHNVKIVFMTESENYKVMYSKKALNQLKNICKNAELIGINAYASTAKRAVQIINYLKILNKPIVWGGIHATISPEDCIKHVNLVCVGEGEEALLELVNNLEKNKPINKIKNLWIKENKNIIKNELRFIIEDVDKLPFPDHDIEDHYIHKKGKIRKFRESDLDGQVFFLTGRGCPYSCTYCSNKLFNTLYEGKRKSIVRWHSPDYIISCIKYLTNRFKSLDYFDIRDDTFSFRSVENIKEFCEKYKKEIGLRFKCLGDPRTVSDEKIKLLIDAGCTDIIIGIQAVERVNFEIYERTQKDEQVLKCAKILNKYKDKLTVMYDIITCNPYETPEDTLNAIRLLKKIPKPYFLSVNNLVFFTGSDLYKKAKKDGTIKIEKDSAANLNYWDRWKHIQLKKKNEYLVLILNLMRGVVTKKRFGLMPTKLINFLIKPNIVKFNLKHKWPTYTIGSLVQIMDLFREKIAKPFYRSLPIHFKVWYDKSRYRT